MKIPEILNAMKAAQPKLFTKLSDHEARQFASGLFAEIGRVVDSTQEGAAIFPKFGRFKVKQVQSKDDPQVKVRRVAFIRAKPTTKVVKKKSA